MTSAHAQLEQRVLEELKKVHEGLLANGELLTPAQLTGYYATFRDKFGPDRLASVDGEPLLSLMHDHGNRDSLVYWLEFKDDEEFPARFGSIAGGSALKFGIYRRRETGNWMTGSPRDQRPISIDEAVQRARVHRDQLLRGVELLDRLPQDAGDPEYAELQKAMDEASPDVGNSAWGHKYFSLLFPEKLDDYHSPDWQRFHLIALLQVPPEGNGRYLCAGRYVRIARRLGWPTNQLTAVLNRQAPKHAYWRVGTSDGTKSRNRWTLMRDGDCVAIGWSQIGNLSERLETGVDRDAIVKLLQQAYPDKAPQTIGRDAAQILDFISTIAEHDIVLACDGATVLGVGRVQGPYYFSSESDFNHRRPVSWLCLDEWRMPDPEGLQSTVRLLRRKPTNLVEAERRILHASPVVKPPPPVGPQPGIRLQGLAGRIQSVLERKGQVILYGPPGTGKTYWALRTAKDLASQSQFGVPFASLEPDKKHLILGNGSDSPGLVRLCCFHPSYGYEDFVEGLRPQPKGEQMHFLPCDGLFKRLCEEAARHPTVNHFLIIDEINRGDVPRIFGELLHGMEWDKRGSEVTLLSGKMLRVPRNLFLIGTMNTADRSVALLDTALRRRFGFVELLPDSTVLENIAIAGIPLAPGWTLSTRLCRNVGRDARNLQIGHAYLFDGGKPVSDFARLARILRDDVIPLLQEYCYEDYDALEAILGKGLVDSENQRIRSYVFEESRQSELVQALLAPCPEISTSAQAAITESPAEPGESDDGEDNEGEVSTGP